MFAVTQYTGFGAARTGTQTGGTATPPNTPTLSDWYDFSDEATLTTTGTFLVSAADKSTYSGTASSTVISTFTLYPSYEAAVQNGLGAARFPETWNGSGTDYQIAARMLQRLGTRSVPPLAGRTVVGVGRYLSLSPSTNLVGPVFAIEAPNNIGGGFRAISTTASPSGAILRMMVIGSSPGAAFAVAEGNLLDRGDWQLYSARARLNEGAYIRVDGTQISTTQGTMGTLTITNFSTGLIIGADPSLVGVNGWVGYIGEIRYFESALGTDGVFAEEGYLAWKWGLQGQLPSDHPYKTAPP